jgi:hypothetical protein
MAVQQTQESIMDRVRALLALAEHPNTPDPERESAFTQANKLMMRHAIDEVILRAGQTQEERRKPVAREFTYLNEGYEFLSYMRTILAEIAWTNRCRAVITRWDRVTVVGFQEDVNWIESLYLSVHFSFLRALFPQWDVNLTFEENVYRYKMAGYKWSKIAHISNENGFSVSWPDGGALIRAYRRHAKRIGDIDPIATHRHEAYRRSFADGFSRRIAARLEQMRDDNKRMSVGSEVALFNASEDITVLFYEMFPELSPKAREASLVKARLSAQQERDAEENMLSQMTQAQRDKYIRDKERRERRRAQQDDTYWRKQDERNRSDEYGVRQGRTAAEAISLDRSGLQVDHNERIEIEDA